MLAIQQTESVPCAPYSLPGGLSRTRFFDGMFLGQKDLEREQSYWRTKRRLTNRALGSGVVWGLRLDWDSRTRRFHLGPGYALDCCGNDLVVECPQEIAERTLVDMSDLEVRALIAGETTPFGRCPEPVDPQGPRKACVVLQYVECPEEPRPIHQDACTTDISSCEFSSVRETTRFLLVPPPPQPKRTPLEDFCVRMEELRSEGESEDPPSELFVSPAVSGEIGAVITMRAQFAGTDAELTRLRPRVEADLQHEWTDRTPSSLEFRLEPEPGCVFLGGKVTYADGDEDTVAPFGVDLGRITSTTTFTIEDLAIAPLFGDGSYTTSTVILEVENQEAPSRLRRVRVRTLNPEPVPGPAGCAAAWTPGVFTGDDPTCVVKTLVLSLVSGWFKGLIGDEDDPVHAGRSLLAWRVCLVAWRLLFNADLTDEKRPRLVDLLQRLFDEWCSGFVYPGPRCTDAHHGVYLGCVEISSRGNIVGFDAWEHRRHVITGPVLAHWGGQFGLAPIDVVGSRLVRWICCVASSGNIDLPAPAADDQSYYYPVAQGDAAIYYGMRLADTLAARGLSQVGDIRTVSFAEFSRELLRTVVESTPAAGREYGAHGTDSVCCMASITWLPRAKSRAGGAGGGATDDRNGWRTRVFRG